MLTLVDANRRIQWDTFTNQNKFTTQVLVNVGVASVSQQMLDVMLSEQQWNGVRYLDEDSFKIGYGIGDPTNEQGQTEADAYAEWIGDVRNRQKILRAQLPVVNLPQTVFDALVSLYVDTGSWRTIVADEGTYDLASAIKGANWLLVADILSRGKINPDLRRREAGVAQLASYVTTKTRSQLTIEGIQRLRKSYITGIANEFDKKQTEFVYFRQLGIFLPGMSQLRQRRVVAQAVT